MGFFTGARFALLVCIIGRIHGDEVCADTEVSIPSHSTTNLLHFSVANSVNDLRQKVSSSRYRSLTGKSQVDIATKLNLYAAGHASVSRVVPCSDLTSSEVAALAQKLKTLTDDKVSLLFPEVDGRQVYVDPGVASLFDSPAMHNLQCAETMKLWAHHIPTSVKNNLPTTLTLPAVPIFNEDELMTELLQNNKTLSCVAGHTALDSWVDEDEDLGEMAWPHWPSKIYFRARASGPYPFWQFGPVFGATDKAVGEQFAINETFEDLYNGGDLEVWHNSKKKATTFYHAHCVWDYLGYGFLGTRPCVAMQFGTYEQAHAGKWLLFTADSLTKSSDGVFCCSSTLETQGHRNLGTINRKFVDNMKYLGNVDFHGYFYDGPAKQYALVMADPQETPVGGAKLPLEVWYETDMQDKPLRFAEIGKDKRFLDDYVLQSSDLPFLYEEMDPLSFSENFSDSVFDIPEVCNVENLPTCAPGPRS